MAQKRPSDGSRLAALLLPYPSALLARRCGVTMRSAQRWRSGRAGLDVGNDNLPKLEQLPALARATRIPIGKLRVAWAADRRARA